MKNLDVQVAKCCGTCEYFSPDKDNYYYGKCKVTRDKNTEIICVCDSHTDNLK